METKKQNLLNNQDLENLMNIMSLNSNLSEATKAIKSKNNEAALKALKSLKDKPAVWAELLITAMTNQHFKSVEYILENYGVEAKGSLEISPILLTTDILLDQSSVKNIFSENKDKDLYQNIKVPVSLIAAISGDIDILSFIQDKGANLNVTGHITISKKNKNSVISNILGASAYYGRVQLTDYILQKLPVDINFKSTEKKIKKKSFTNIIKELSEMTPLLLCVVSDAPENFSIEIIHLLIEKNANFQAVDYNKNTFLHLAVKFNKLNIIKHFSEKILQFLYSTNKDGQTPIGLAQEIHNVDILNFLSTLIQSPVKNIEEELNELIEMTNKQANKKKHKNKNKDKDEIRLLNSSNFQETIKFKPPVVEKKPEISAENLAAKDLETQKILEELNSKSKKLQKDSKKNEEIEYYNTNPTDEGYYYNKKGQGKNSYATQNEGENNSNFYEYDYYSGNYNQYDHKNNYYTGQPKKNYNYYYNKNTQFYKDGNNPEEYDTVDKSYGYNNVEKNTDHQYYNKNKDYKYTKKTYENYNENKIEKISTIDEKNLSETPKNTEENLQAVIIPVEQNINSNKSTEIPEKQELRKNSSHIQEKKFEKSVVGLDEKTKKKMEKKKELKKKTEKNKTSEHLITAEEKNEDINPIISNEKNEEAVKEIKNEPEKLVETPIVQEKVAIIQPAVPQKTEEILNKELDNPITNPEIKQTPENNLNNLNDQQNEESFSIEGDFLNEENNTIKNLQENQPEVKPLETVPQKNLIETETEHVENTPVEDRKGNIFINDNMLYAKEILKSYYAKCLNLEEDLEKERKEKEMYYNIMMNKNLQLSKENNKKQAYSANVGENVDDLLYLTNYELEQKSKKIIELDYLEAKNLKNYTKDQLNDLKEIYSSKLGVIIDALNNIK